MFSKYALASVLAVFRHTVGGLGIGLQTVAAYAEHALLQVCEDLNSNRKKKVDEFQSKARNEELN